MVVDTSALVAIVTREPEADSFRRQMVDDPNVLVSAGTYLETAVVLEMKFGEAAGRELGPLLDKARAQIMSFTPEQARIAHMAYRLYGKGRHRARLNLGDCMSYALAKSTGEPLLFKGGDFAHTDVPRCR